jgi:hypothetical protein
VHRRNPLITPFLASMPLEVRRHPDLLGGLQDVGEPLMAALHGMFESARDNGEIPSDVADLDLMIAFIGSAMGIGLLSYGLRSESMDAAAGIIQNVLFGNFFREQPDGGR